TELSILDANGIQTYGEELCQLMTKWIARETDVTKRGKVLDLIIETTTATSVLIKTILTVSLEKKLGCQHDQWKKDTTMVAVGDMRYSMYKKHQKYKCKTCSTDFE